MRESKSSEYTNIPYDLRYTSGRRRNSPSSSILKSPTPFFITSRNSSVRTRRLKFANGPDGDELLNDMREGSYDSASTSTSIGELPDILKGNYDSNGYEEKFIEVPLSPVKTMKVSPDSWNAFLEYQKYKDHSNETEKTDYTYSKLSKYCDREIIPGFRIRPNLSRKPIHLISTDQTYSPSWSPEVNYFVKKTVYECNSPPRGNIDEYDTFERDELYKNEMSDYTRHDGYFSDDALREQENYQNYLGYGSDGRVLFRRKGFGFSNLSADKHSISGTSWGFDDTVDDVITTGVGGKSYSSWGKVIVFLTAVCTAMFRGIASILSLCKDLFSRYILRRNIYPYSYSSTGTRFGPQSYTYSYEKYAGSQGRLSNWWYQSFLYTLYSKITSSISRSGQYIRTKYYQSSRKGRLLWFLIPFLLLIAFWLFRAEGEDAFVSNKMTELKCKANQYISPARNQMKSIWKEISSYSERIFGQSLEPVKYLLHILVNVASVLIQWMLSLISHVMGTVLTIIGFLKDLCTHFWTTFANYFSDAVEKKAVISSTLYSFFSGILYTVSGTASIILQSLGKLLSDTLQYLKYFIPFYFVPHEGNEVIGRIQPMKADFQGNHFNEIGADWESLKRRIEDLEMELKKVKEEKSTGDIQYQKQLEENYKSLQKYQVIMNEALRRQSIKPVQLSKTFMQYYLGNATDELKKWILAHFVLKGDSKELDENKFEMLMAKYSNKSGEELKSLQNEFARFVRQYSAELSSIKTDLNVAQYQDVSGNDVSLSVIKRIVTDEIKLHDADKTGKVDYALQSAGGQVLGVKCTKNFHHCFKYSSIFGFHVCAQKRKNAPEEAINPGMAPGQCWAFVGSQGFLTLELSHSIIVTGFTMEHISRMLSPNGRIESAPRSFSMWGLKSEFDLEPYLFGEYEYEDNNETYQYFPVFNYSPHPYKIVELNIASNHGNPNYTCLYRIRVHGDMYPSHL